MEYIYDLDKLDKLVEESEEPIVYSLREEGIVFLDYFRYSNKMYNYGFGWAPFLCIAKEDSPGLFVRSIQGMFTVPLRFLPHFKDSANFFVAVPAEQIEHVLNVLENFGCKNIFVATDKVIAQMKNKISEFRVSGRILNWSMNYFMKEIDDIKNLAASQVEIADTHKKIFGEYRNAFRDKKVVIVATGPTLKYYKPIEDAIHIGMNFAWRNENILLNYLFTQDEKINRTTDSRVEDGFDRIKDKIFIANYPYSDEWYRYPENYSLYKNVLRYFTNRRYIGQTIHQDICYYALADFCSVSFNALHFALFTYPKEIYLVGCDTSPTGHFYDKKNSSEHSTNNDMLTGNLKIGYARMKVFAEQYYPDTQIFSINPVGLKGLFKDVYTEDYKKFLQEV